jgi:hypothetical protein
MGSCCCAQQGTPTSISCCIALLLTWCAGAALTCHQWGLQAEHKIQSSDGDLHLRLAKVIN